MKRKRYGTIICKGLLTFVLAVSLINLNTVVIHATGKNFADALSGSYLAVVKNAPILLTNGKADNIVQLHAYIQENVIAGGTVYILGGTGAVPASVEELEGYEVTRLFGPTRYDTNFAILEEAGITGEDWIVATGKSFADSLSASAAGKPILLVKPDAALSNEAKMIVDDMKNIYIIGGEGALSNQTILDVFNLENIENMTAK